VESSARSAGGRASVDTLDAACVDVCEVSDARCVGAFSIASIGITVAGVPMVSVARYLALRHA